MKTENILEELIGKMINTYRKYGDDKMLVYGNTPYTGNQIADAIEAGDEFGKHTIDNMIQLALDLTKREKVNNPDDIKTRLLNELRELKADERMYYPSATVFENAPLALIQIASEAKINLIEKTLGIPFSSFPLTH